MLAFRQSIFVLLCCTLEMCCVMPVASSGALHDGQAFDVENGNSTIVLVISSWSTLAAQDVSSSHSSGPADVVLASRTSSRRLVARVPSLPQNLEHGKRKAPDHLKRHEATIAE
eukprot:TRINITY_DN4453_c0_g1_i1.p1 TRINITY_DN4453_c0_g1~~TRINITY_DN4453_c0_g1_i1.p1  ORF type:complete len:114 (+),score=9.75 TRINITY_DN4453_c0_g1_i1:287-628(+)